MALQTKTIQGSTNHSLWTWKMEVIENSTDSENLTSSVTVKSYLGRAAGSSTQSFGGTASINITCNGESRTNNNANWNYGAINIAGGSWYEIQSETFTVKHNEDGTKTIDVSSSLSTSSFNPNSASASGSMELTTIETSSIRIKVNGAWKKATPYIKVNGAWKKATAYVKLNGAWKKGK